MPYVKRKYAKCKECEDTNTLFHARNKTLKDGTIVLRVSRVCRPCFLLKQSEYNAKTSDENKRKYLAQKKEHYYKNIEKMRERGRQYHYKNMERENMKRKLRHENSHKKTVLTKEQEFISKMKSRVNLGNRDNFYLVEKI